MELIIAELINNPKIPKWLRYVIVTAICGAIIVLGVMLAIKSPMLAGRIFGGFLSALFAVAAIYLYVEAAAQKSQTIPQKITSQSRSKSTITEI